MKARGISSFFSPFFLFCCVQVISAQTVFIVDAAGGPGFRFRDLPQAVGRAPSGSCLMVRAGSYSPFRVRGKTFRIEGAGPGKTVIQITSPGQVVSIWGIPKGETFIMEDLDIQVSATSATLAPYLEIQGGRCFLGNVRVRSTGQFFYLGPQPGPHGQAEVVVAQAELLALKFQVTAGALVYLNLPTGGLPFGLHALQSRLQFTDCKILGASGGGVDVQKNGTAALHLERSILDLSGGVVRGGWGGTGSKSRYSRPGDGGPAIHLEKGSLALGEGCYVEGGCNGCYQLGFGGWKVGSPGVGVLVDSKSGADFHGSTVLGGYSRPWGQNRAAAWAGPGIFKSRPGPVHRPRLTVTHHGPAGRENRLEAKGVPGRLHVLLAGPRPAWIPLGPLGFPGTLQVDPGDFLVLPFRLSSKGTWSLDLPGITASSLPGPFWLQVFMAPEGDQVVSSNAVPLLLWP